MQKRIRCDNINVQNNVESTTVDDYVDLTYLLLRTNGNPNYLLYVVASTIPMLLRYGRHIHALLLATVYFRKCFRYVVLIHLRSNQ